MKPVVPFVALGMLTLFLSGAHAQIRLKSLNSLPPLDLGSTNLSLGLSNQPPGQLFKPLSKNPTQEIPRAKPPTPHPFHPGGQLTNFFSPERIPQDRGLTLSQPAPLHWEQVTNPPGQLAPGVYQTYPYSMILMVPEGGIDDRILGEPPNNNSKMPRIKPHVRAIPLSQAKP